VIDPTMRAAALIAAALLISPLLSGSPFANAQRGRGRGAAGDKPKVDIVQTVGCAEQKSNVWFLTRAAEPSTTTGGIFNSKQVETAKGTPLGAEAFQLVGTAEFVDPEELLRTGQRKEFTTPQNANATGQLRAGRKLLVKGLLIPGETRRINLISVVALADTCS
jgi:hypothetical protein